MESALSVTLKPTFHHQKNPLLNSPNFNLTKSNLPYPLLKPFKFKQPTNASSTTAVATATKPQNNPIIQTLKLTARAIVFSAAAAAVISKFQQYPAIAEPITQTLIPTESETQIPEFLESNSEPIDAMKELLEKKLEAGEDEESLKILKKLVSAQPENFDWKFLTARLLNETGETESAREALEQILTQNPLSFEALFENAVLVDSCGEDEAVVTRLEKALEIAVKEHNEKDAKNVRLLIAQVKFLQENVDEALKRYDELLSEDPNDFRPHFCKGMVYSLIDKNDEAKVEFAKYRELSPKKLPLSRLKLFGTDDQN